MTATLTAPIATDITLDSAAALPDASDALQAALAAVSVASDTDSTARSTLARITLDYYRFYAERYARTVSGVAVLPDNHKRDVSTLLWIAATGTPTPVPAKERTPGETSFGQYISRYARVASHLMFGVAALSDLDSANKAHKAVTDSNAAVKANAAAAAEALADQASAKAFGEWLTSQPADMQAAFRKVARALKNDAAPHMDAFIASATKTA